MSITDDYKYTKHSRPPAGWKKIDLAKRQLSKLEMSVQDCETDTVALTLSSARWLEDAFYSREIIEEDYDNLMTKIKEQTRKFIDNCKCLSS